MLSSLELNNFAIKLRKQWGEDDYSPIDVFGLTYLADNITLITMEMPSDMSGMCVKADSDIVIAINSAMSLGRQRFTIAHELYHAFFDESMMTYVCMNNLGGKKSDSEKEADFFASFFLAPYSSLDGYLDKTESKVWDISTVVKAELFYGISHQALLVRLLHEGRISQQMYDNYKEIKVTSVAEKLGLDLTLYRNSLKTKPYSCTGNYLRKIQQAYERGLIGEGKKYELLGDGFADLDYDTGEVIDD